MDIKKLMSTDIDYVIITNPANVFYFTRYNNPDAIIVLSHDTSYYITDARYEEESYNNVKDYKIIISNSIIKELKVIINTASVLGIEESLTYGFINKINEAVSPKRYIDITERIKSQREIKSLYEIDSIKKAASINDRAYAHIIDFLKEGVRELEIAAEIEYFMKKQGAEGIAFDTIVAFGAGSSQPHHHTGMSKLKKYDLITIDCGSLCNGYCSDITRTFAYGLVDERIKNVYNIVLEANKLGILSARSGMRSGELDSIVREYIDKCGYGEHFQHSLGHGVGINIHERPSIRNNGLGVLNSGQIATIEPGIYIKGEFGIRIEDLVLINDNGVQVLSQFNKELMIL